MRQPPFIGRDEELKALQLELALTQTHGRMALVVGEPGIGKSRLLSEFAERNRRRALFLTSRGSPMSTASPFSVFVEALESHLRSLAPDQLKAAHGDRITELRDLFPSIGGALGPAQEPVPSRLRILEAIRHLLETVASPRPLVLIIDDLHQADPSSWECVNYLARNPPAGPVLLLATVRRGELFSQPPLTSLVATLLKDRLASEVRLLPLSLEQVMALARRTVTDSGDPHLGEWLFARAGGNPLYTLALLQELANDPTQRVVPISVQESVRVALHDLSDASRFVIEAAAVIGHSFSLASILAMTALASAGDIERLVDKNLIVESRRPGKPGYDFVHPLVQEAIYSGLGPARRRELHQLAALALAAEPVRVRAYHVGLGALPGDPYAVALLREAARDAENTQAHREALVNLERALELIPPSDQEQRRDVLDEIAWQASSASDHKVGIAALEALIPLVADDPAELGRTHVRMSSFLATGAGDLTGAEMHAAKAVALLSRESTSRLLPAALNELAWIHGEAGDLAAQVVESRQAAAGARAFGQTEVVMRALGCGGHALALLGRPVEAIEALHESLSHARASGDRAQIGWHTGGLVEALLHAGRVQEAAALADQLLDREDSFSDVAYMSRARVNWFLGTWDSALSDARMVQALNPSAPSAHSAWTLSMAGLVLAGAGRTDEAESFVAQADRIYGGRDFYVFTAWNDWVGGYTLWVLGKLEEAQARLERSVARLIQMGASGTLAQILPDLAQLESVMGHEIKADDLEQRARNAAPPGVDWFDVPVRKARSLEQAATRLGAADRDSALAAAAGIYASLPMPVEEKRVLAALRGAGAAGRRAARGAGSLSGREVTVARLAAEGLTTSQIATKLGIGERTVETHLAHVYSKLGLRSRRDLTLQDLSPAGGDR